MKLSLLLIAVAAFAQETAPPPPELTPAEKQFQDSMENVKLVGHYTLGDNGSRARFTRCAVLVWKPSPAADRPDN
jgi:hypothetical protein